MRNLALVWVLAGVAVALLAAGDGKPSVSTFTDTRDGKVYKIVKIGSQTWFAENLNYALWGSKCYENKANNCAKYGRLYNWKKANKACPAGWRLPNDDDWTTLLDYVGGSDTAGKKLKSTSGWENNGNGTDDYGFSALPGGIGDGSGVFFNAGYVSLWWSATERVGAFFNVGAWSMSIEEYVYRVEGIKEMGLSYVRCLQDDEKESQK